MNIKKLRWLHGSKEEFKSWVLPPPLTENNKNLYPHSGLFFTTQMSYAKKFGNNVCKVKLKKDINLLDMRNNNMKLETFRKYLVNEKISRLHKCTQNKDIWIDCCKSGKVFMFEPYNPDVYTFYQNKVKLDYGDYMIEGHYSSKFLTKINMNRAWIEELIKVGKELNYDGIMAYEYVNMKKIRKKKYEILIIFSTDTISNPIWYS